MKGGDGFFLFDEICQITVVSLPRIKSKRKILYLALDRIVSLAEEPEVPFMEDPGFDPEAWFADMV